MKIDKTIYTDQGAIQFQGELEGIELDLVIGVGLNYLMKHGALPMLISSQQPQAAASEEVH